MNIKKIIIYIVFIFILIININCAGYIDPLFVAVEKYSFDDEEDIIEDMDNEKDIVIDSNDEASQYYGGILYTILLQKSNFILSLNYIVYDFQEATLKIFL